MNFTRRRTMRVGMAAGLAAVAPAAVADTYPSKPIQIGRAHV